MTKRNGRVRRTARVFRTASVVLATSVLGMGAIAAHIPGATYTGCLDMGMIFGLEGLTLLLIMTPW